MTLLSVLLAALALPSVVVWAVQRRRRTADPAPQDLRRAGDGGGMTARDAALKAGGRTAWMRAGGGGA